MSVYPVIRALARTSRERWHSMRAELFLAKMRPGAGARVLDLGGGDGEFMARVRSRVAIDVTVADIDEGALARASSRGLSTVQLRENEPLPFDHNEFDIVFCNSVIEHATLPKSACKTTYVSDEAWIRDAFCKQREFARELRRVGRGYFVQTPHRSFPIESHTWLPLVGWLPHNATLRVVNISDRIWVKHTGKVDWNLLDEQSIQELLPDASLHVERVFGLPKSLIAYREI